MIFQRVKGSYDIIPGAREIWKDSASWQWIEGIIRELSEIYGFHEIRLPIFEHTNVFVRGVGDESDIVSKELYTFCDKAGRSLSLRPELTSSIVRAYVENHLQYTTQERFFYFGPCFRYDRMQRGRFRQFCQFGAEHFSRKDPFVDAEMIDFLVNFYRILGFKEEEWTLRIHFLGNRETREVYAEVLRKFFLPEAHNLSEDSRRRMKVNPLRIFDSKEENDCRLLAEAPKMIDFLMEQEREYFHFVLKILEDLKISYIVDEKLVRGLDYYCGIVFEIIDSSDFASQNALGGGGRYDGLVRAFGGKDISGIGFAVGLERTLQFLEKKDRIFCKTKNPLIYFLPLCEEAKGICFSFLREMRRGGKIALLHIGELNVKKGLRAASRKQSKYVLLLGEREISEKRLIIKNLFNGDELKLSMDDQLVHYLLQLM